MKIRIFRERSPAWISGICALVASVVSFPSLFAGFFYDDHLQIAQLEGRAPPRGGVFDLYNFAGGGAETASLIQHGPLPWWTSPDFRMHFWRPLSSAAIALQYALFGENAVAFHAFSLLLQATLIFAVGALFRRALPTLWPPALLLFAIDDAHWDAVGWVAANNSVLALLFAVLALLAYRRHREQKWKPGLAWALIATALSLLAGEPGVGALAYVGAYEVLGTSHRRLVALWPFAAMLVLYAIMYKLGGYGVRDHIGYLDPLAESITFLKGAALRIPGLFGNLALGVPLELWWQSDAIRLLFALVGFAAFVGISLWLRAALTWISLEERRAVLWLALGAMIALFPSCAGPPGQRVLFVTSLGAAPAFSLLLRDGWARLHARQDRVAATGFVLLFLPNAVLAPLLFSGKLFLLGKLGDYAAHMTAETERMVAESESVRGEGWMETVRVAILSSDDPLTLIYVPFLRRSQAPWRAFWTLSSNAVPKTIRRVDGRTLELSTTEHFFETELEVALYGGRRPPLGSSVRLDGADATVVGERDGYPTHITLRFDDARDMKHLHLITWRDQQVYRVTVPEIGQSITLPAAQRSTLFNFD